MTNAIQRSHAVTQDCAHILDIEWTASVTKFQRATLNGRQADRAWAQSSRRDHHNW